MSITAAAAVRDVDAERLRRASRRPRARRRRSRSAVSPPSSEPLVEIAEQQVAVGHGRLGAAAADSRPGPARRRRSAGRRAASPAGRPRRSSRRRPRPRRDRSTGTRIGWPVPFIQRLALAPPPTSYSGVVSYSPSRIRLALAVVPPMSKERRSSVPVWSRDEAAATTPAAGPGLDRHGRHGDAFGGFEHAAVRAHHIERRQAECPYVASSSRARYEARIGPT